MIFLQEAFLTLLEQLNRILWDWPCMLVCFLAAGLYFSVRTGFFQFRRMGLWLSYTWHELVGEESECEGKTGKKNGISQRQSICTALAATVGTGNIVGVATAIVAGGPGAVFWMWISAFLGMMSGFAEKVLGILYRRQERDSIRNQKGDIDQGGAVQYKGGPMYYMEDGLQAKGLAVVYAFLCAVASFGIGNVTQIHSMAGSLKEAFGVPGWITGVVAATVTAVVLVGGIRRISAFTEKLVPFMVILYMGCAVMVLVYQAEKLLPALKLIVSEAFRLRSAVGGAAGYGIARAMSVGVARGIFTNEAGLGASVIAHSASDTQEPVHQGMWGIFEVFADTIVVCTVTALVILTTGLASPASVEGLDGVVLTMACFRQFFPWGDQLIAVCMTLFAFGSLIGWSLYGQRAVEYLCGRKGIFAYKILYVLVVTVGSIASLEVVWKMADVCNGLMAIPNLMALFLLRKKVLSALQNYEKKEEK